MPRGGTRRAGLALSSSKREEVLRYLKFAMRNKPLSRNIEKLLVILVSKTGRGTQSGIEIQRKPKTD
jgi:hypothetical protein